MSLRELLLHEHLVVFLGTGGVGKTTLAASAAVEAALAGRRVALLTIDPARRLANALGVASLEDTATRVPLAGADLDALVLMPERTFDRLVGRFAASESARQRILENPIYRHVSRSLAGSAEYAAMERVHELLSDPSYDLVVLDTPPSAHALDFLEAPQRLLWLFDSSVLRHLLHPAFAAGRLGLQWFQRASARVFQLMERITGIGFLEELSEFLLAFEAISGALRSHAEEVQATLRGASTVLVASASPESAKNAARFWERLEEASATPRGIVWNRVHPLPTDSNRGASPLPSQKELEKWLGARAPEGKASRWAHTALQAAHRYVSSAEAETRTTEALSIRTERAGGFVSRVPEVPFEIHDLAGLRRLGATLGTATAAARPEPSD